MSTFTAVEENFIIVCKIMRSHSYYEFTLEKLWLFSDLMLATWSVLATLIQRWTVDGGDELRGFHDFTFSNLVIMRDTRNGYEGVITDATTSQSDDFVIPVSTACEF
jgi:hypothetical protein